MLGPEMKAGQTRKSWDTGYNNVIPFPAVGIATCDILYAYKGDVALDLGYSSHSHFTAAFRQAFGIAPSAFRRKATAEAVRELSARLGP